MDKTTIDHEILKLFKVMIANADCLNLMNATRGFVTNFNPTPRQLKILQETFKPLNVTTLFTVEEREAASLDYLVSKQILHYIEVYGLNAPGLFNLEQTNGTVATVAYVTGVTREELGDKVRSLLYANAPVKDTVALKDIIDGYGIDFDLKQVKNNELCVLLFRLGKDKFDNGDDAVRYMCYTATESALLIKSKQVIKKIEEHGSVFSPAFFLDHLTPLAQVFHRHKNLILAAKTPENRHAINRISRLAKTQHVPVYEPLNKRFIAEAYAGRAGSKELRRMSLRDKFKFLNLLTYKAVGNTTDAFVIRNGKVHIEKGRPVLDGARLVNITGDVLDSVKENLSHLQGASILLDANVDYGLPISRKQVIGQLPFGTTVRPNGETISAGIYWEDGWGARDLDLSAIEADGRRTGWGQYSGYTRNDVVFSGDVTQARDGAMEFMTSSVNYGKTYALFVNIFAGEEGAKFALVVGSKSNGKWIESPVLREVGELQSKGNIIGFVKNGRFVVYGCRVNNSAWSGGNKETAILSRGLASFWTVRALLDSQGISYSMTREVGRTYDYDLSYQGFSLDKLESMFSA